MIKRLLVLALLLSAGSYAQGVGILGGTQFKNSGGNPTVCGDTIGAGASQQVCLFASMSNHQFNPMVHLLDMGLIFNQWVTPSTVLPGTFFLGPVDGSSFGLRYDTGAWTLGGPLTFLPQAQPTSPPSGQTYFDSTAHALEVYNGSSWTVLGSGGGSTGQTAYNVRRWGYSYPTATNLTTLSNWGIQALTQLGSGAAVSSAFTDILTQVNTSTTSANSNCGWGGPFTETRSQYGSKFVAHWKSNPGSGAHYRIYVGLTDGSGVSGVLAANPPTTVTASSFHVAVFAVDSTVSANWLLVTGDGTNWSGTDSGVAFTGAHASIWETIVDWTNPASIVFTLNEVSSPGRTVTNVFTVTKTTNLDASTTALGVLAASQNVSGGAGTAHSFFTGFIGLEQNN